MNRDEIDVLWQRALHESVRDGEQFARYHFAKIIRNQALEDAAVMCGAVYYNYIGPEYGVVRYGISACEQAIRAMKEQT